VAGPDGLGWLGDLLRHPKGRSVTATRGPVTVALRR
jgi:hypothetical protein